jgi:hypothetical protein
MSDEFVVNGLPLPPLLISLIQEGRWKHPGDEKMREAIVFLHDPVVFVSLEEILSQRDTALWMADDPRMSALFYTVRGSRDKASAELPWLDAEKCIFIAVNAAPGDDVGIALDYRVGLDAPRVVASDWQTAGCLWREVTPTFSEFVERLDL